MSRRKRKISIVGGGLAGLSLGIALRRQSVPVTLYEAEEFPRHKVCGEFIAGLSSETTETLGIGDLLKDAEHHRSLTWFRDGKAFRSDCLHRPALGISRYRLDQRLAQRFVELGGRLEIGRRIATSTRETEGWVWATGRRKGKGPTWIGLKVHCRSFPLVDDLEMHLGENGYVGANAVEAGRVNVCGLFRARPIPQSDRRLAILGYLKASGFESLAERVLAGDPDRQSHRAVSGITFGANRQLENCIQIGDAYALMPPFAGDGMAMCFQGSAAVVRPIRDYIEGDCSWPETCRESRRALASEFRTRLAVGRSLHPFLYRKAGQSLFRAASASRLLPFPLFFALLHKTRLS